MIDRGHEAGGDHVIDEAPGPAPGIREFEDLTDEFAALHRCAKILTADDGGLDEMLGALAAVLPPALRSSGRATAAVRYDERLYATPGHEVTAWMLCSNFTTTDGRRGSIEIAYLEPWPPPDDGQGRYLRAATRLIESVADLTRTALDRRRAADEAGRKLEVLGQVAAGVAHDFNNVLLVINGAALELESQGRAERETVREIQDAADRAAGLVRQLLAFSHSSEVHPEAVEINAMVERMR